MNHYWNFQTQTQTESKYQNNLYPLSIYCQQFLSSPSLFLFFFFTANSLHLCVSTHAARSKSMVLGELSRLSRPCSPLDQEKALKAGWLKRQRSIMKNWQLRWFVLKAEALYFYKDQDETKAQVTQAWIPPHYTYTLWDRYKMGLLPSVIWIQIEAYQKSECNLIIILNQVMKCILRP